MDVRGHGAIVTGGGSGLGAETARHLAAPGALVAALPTVWMVVAARRS